jgi:hypothetical protein
MEMHRLEAPAESRKIQKAQRSDAPLRAGKGQDTVGGYDTKMPLHGTLDRKIYLALSEICEFAAVTEHPVGWRQSTGRMSRDVTAMVQATELISRWLSEKRTDLPKEVGHRRTYNLRTYLARRATENELFLSLCDIMQRRAPHVRQDCSNDQVSIFVAVFWLRWLASSGLRSGNWF